MGHFLAGSHMHALASLGSVMETAVAAEPLPGCSCVLVLPTRAPCWPIAAAGDRVFKEHKTQDTVWQ